MKTPILFAAVRLHLELEPGDQQDVRFGLDYVGENYYQGVPVERTSRQPRPWHARALPGGLLRDHGAFGVSRGATVVPARSSSDPRRATVSPADKFPKTS